MSDLDTQSRIAAGLHDRRATGYVFARPRGASNRYQVYAAKRGTAQWVPIEDIIGELLPIVGGGEGAVMRALASMQLPSLKVASIPPMSERLEDLIRSAQQLGGK